MNQLLLGPLLRYVDETSATIWVETERPCSVSVLGSVHQTFSVGGRHYALAIVDGLEPGSTVAYQVELDGELVWPPADSDLPPSVIRTHVAGGEVSLLVGSCRAAAPHEPPYTLELAFDNEGRGVDTLWAHALRASAEPPEKWPDLLVLVGDQIYADDSSPRAKERIEHCRLDTSDLPPEIVAGFEEYCWLYHEAWSSELERWLLSVTPSIMIFDDHDMIDDWNISASWVTDIRKQAYWQEHAIGGLMSYWIYQHLGNLSPTRIVEEGLLAELLSVDDATDILRQWAFSSEEFTPVPGGYRFSFTRQVGDVTVVVIDARNGRVLDKGSRLMVDEKEWGWICDEARAAKGHLVLATSLPVFIADGLHDLQVWNERVCDGAWGGAAARVGERIRRHLDLEDWSAFGASYTLFVELLEELKAASTTLESIVVASGDIHFSYAASVPLSGGSGPPVWQVVSSPIRNALIPPERGVMRATLTRAGRFLGSVLRRASRAADTRPGIEMAVGPFFANNMCELHYRQGGVELVIEQSTPTDDGDAALAEVAHIDLLQGGRALPTSGEVDTHV